jgi:type IV pilus assembly protein PilE
MRAQNRRGRRSLLPDGRLSGKPRGPCLFNYDPSVKREIRMSRQQGFTLIELMIVVVLIAVLAAIAMPSYTNYIKRGKAMEATAQLADMRVKLEQWYQDNRTWAAVGATIPIACTDSTSAALPGRLGGTAVKYFTYACSLQTATTYKVTATGTITAGDQTMAGFTYTIDQANAKTTQLDPASGWVTATTTYNCWITRKGDSC